MEYENIRKEMIKTALQLKEYQLISLCGGNVSVRLPDGNILITPSGMDYESMEPEDICLLSPEGEKIDSPRKPSSDTPALLYIFKHMPSVNAIIHTHQPYATAVGLVEDYFEPCLVTQIDALRGGVNVAPFTISSDENMGVLTVEYAGSSLAVILKNHGVMAYGPDLMTALYSCVYLEEAAKTYMTARAVRNVPALPKEMVEKETRGDVNEWLNYIQSK